MTIRVETPEVKFPIVIPIPLAIAEDILGSLDSIYSIAVKLIPGLKKYNKSFQMGDYEIGLKDISQFSQEFFRELRRIGSFTFVEVEDEDTHISIKIK